MHSNMVPNYMHHRMLPLCKISAWMTRQFSRKSHVLRGAPTYSHLADSCQHAMKQPNSNTVAMCGKEAVVCNDMACGFLKDLGVLLQFKLGQHFWSVFFFSFVCAVCCFWYWGAQLRNVQPSFDFETVRLGAASLPLTEQNWHSKSCCKSGFHLPLYNGHKVPYSSKWFCATLLLCRFVSGLWLSMQLCCQSNVLNGLR